MGIPVDWIREGRLNAKRVSTIDEKKRSREEERVSMVGSTVQGSAHSLQQPLLVVVDGDQSNPPTSNIDTEIESGDGGVEEKIPNGNGNAIAETTGRPKIPWGGEYAKSIVYGGLDAIVTCFSLVSSISAGHLSSVDVLVLGFANLVADGISMGFGDFLSSSTERDLAASKRDVTNWDVCNNLHTQVIELVNTYESLGMDNNDAKMVVEIFAKYRDILVDQMMATQKGILPPDESGSAWKSGVVTFISFLLFGCTPLLSFIVLLPVTHSDFLKFCGACVLSAVALLLLGIAKAKISGQSYVLSALMALSNGGIAAAAAYSIGWLLRHVAGLEN